MTIAIPNLWGYLVAFAGHLKRHPDTGHLLHGDGDEKHLVNDCCPLPETVELEFDLCTGDWGGVECVNCDSESGCEASDCDGDGSATDPTNHRAISEQRNKIESQSITLTRCSSGCAHYGTTACPAGPIVKAEWRGDDELADVECDPPCDHDLSAKGAECSETRGEENLGIKISCGENDGEYVIEFVSTSSNAYNDDCGTDGFDDCTTAETEPSNSCRCQWKATCQTNTPNCEEFCPNANIYAPGPAPQHWPCEQTSKPSECDDPLLTATEVADALPLEDATVTVASNSWTVISCPVGHPEDPCGCTARIKGLPDPGPCDQAP